MGGPGADDHDGGTGSDLLRGGQGTDRLYGGRRNEYDRDTVSFVDSPPGGIDNHFPGVTRDLPNGFPSIASELRGVFIQQDPSVSQEGWPVAWSGPPRLGGGTDYFCRFNEKHECKGVYRFDNIVGSPYADVIHGSAIKSERIYGGDGPDVIRGRGSADRIMGGRDIDYITAAAGSTINTVGQRADEKDHCVRDGSALSTDFCSGADYVVGSGEDVAKVRVGMTNFGEGSELHPRGRREFYVRGSNGSETIDVSYLSSARQIEVVLSGGQFDLNLPDQGCDFSSGATVATCGGFDPRHTENGWGSIGAVVISGRGGDDTLKAGNFPDWTNVSMFGGAGMDAIDGGDSETLIVDGDDDGFTAGQNRGWEILKGGAGDDVIINNRGVDRSLGGDGNDLLMSTSLCDSSGDRSEIVNGGDNVDSAQWAQLYGGTGIFADLEHEKVWANESGSASCTNLTSTVRGQSYTINGAAGELLRINDVESSATDDVIKGTNAANHLLGRGGRDTVYARKGGDTLLMNDKQDDLLIDCGNDNKPDKVRVDFNGRDDPAFDIPGSSNKRCERDGDDVGSATPRYGEGALRKQYSELSELIDPPRTGTDPGDGALYGANIIAVATIDGDRAPYDDGLVSYEGSTATTAQFGLNEATAPDGPILGGQVSSNIEGAADAVYLDQDEDALPTTDPSDLEPPDFVDGSAGALDDGAISLNESAPDQGDSDRVLLEDAASPELDPNVGFSVEFWARFPEGPGSSVEVLYSRGEAGNGLRILRQTDGRLDFVSASPGGTAKVTTAEPVSTGGWHHLVGTLSPDDTIALVVDGFSYELGYDRSVIPVAAGDDPDVFGTLGGDWGQESHFPATVELDEIRLYDGVLGSADIFNHLTESEAAPDDAVLNPPVDPWNSLDDDSDLVTNGDDNCPANANSGQADTDRNGIGDVCEGLDDDVDEDWVLDAEDNCPLVANEDQADTDGDGIGDACEKEDNKEAP